MLLDILQGVAFKVQLRDLRTFPLRDGLSEILLPGMPFGDSF